MWLGAASHQRGGVNSHTVELQQISGHCQSVSKQEKPVAWNQGIYTTYTSPWTKVVTNSMQAIPSFRNCSQNPMPSFQEESLPQELMLDRRATQTGSFSPMPIWSLKALQLPA